MDHSKKASELTPEQLEKVSGGVTIPSLPLPYPIPKPLPIPLPVDPYPIPCW